MKQTKTIFKKKDPFNYIDDYTLEAFYRRNVYRIINFNCFGINLLFKYNQNENT